MVKKIIVTSEQDIVGRLEDLKKGVYENSWIANPGMKEVYLELCNILVLINSSRKIEVK
jgi:hypothetical protein